MQQPQGQARAGMLFCLSVPTVSCILSRICASLVAVGPQVSAAWNHWNLSEECGGGDIRRKVSPWYIRASLTYQQLSIVRMLQKSRPGFFQQWSRSS